jgi:hypothetical protein
MLLLFVVKYVCKFLFNDIGRIGSNHNVTIDTLSDARVKHVKTCATCGKPITQDYQGHREKVYCKPACRQKAYRDRRPFVIRIDSKRSDLEEQIDKQIIESLDTQIQGQEEYIQLMGEKCQSYETHIKYLEHQLAEKEVEIVRLTVLLEGQAGRRKR